MLTLALLLVFADPADPKTQEAADGTTFQAYLKAKKLDGRWQGKPTRLDTPEIRKAYPGRRLYFTFRAPPVPPGAPLPDLLRRYEQRQKEYVKHSLRLTVSIGERVQTLEKAADFNEGLMPVTSKDEARTAAAAILSALPAGHVPPGPVAARDVQVRHTERGWICSFDQPRRFTGTVTFDPTGKVQAVAKQANWIMPVPPSAPPRGRPGPQPVRPVR